ncbi:Txe/YoeB family addiction module toxin [bacterium]|nr:MAG: Txe/YoeB family addiction module toxin [bacterium]
MEIRLAEKADEDRKFFLKSGQKDVLKKIEHLFEEMRFTPFSGTGKPEALKYDKSGVWSRRINREHRLVYEVFENHIDVYSLKGHY